MIKAITLIFFCSVLHPSYGQSPSNVFLDPTGTYVLKGNKHKDEIKGNFAEVRVKLLNDSLLAMAFYCNKGYPEYTSGHFTDTLRYLNNVAVHSSKTTQYCQIIFSFQIEGLSINKRYNDPSATCGFGKGVLPLGPIQKHSSESPIIQSLSRIR